MLVQPLLHNYTLFMPFNQEKTLLYLLRYLKEKLLSFELRLITAFPPRQYSQKNKARIHLFRASLLFILAIAWKHIGRQGNTQLFCEALSHLLMDSRSGMDVGVGSKVVVAVAKPGLDIF